MEPNHLLLAQSLSLSGLVGAAGGYAGIVRRRRDHRAFLTAAAAASTAAVERVDRSMTLSRLNHTFSRSAFRGSGRGFRTRP